MGEGIDKGTQKTYRTSDLYFGAFLCSSRANFQGIEKKEDGKIIFIFLVKEDEIEKKKDLFFKGYGTVNAYRFVDNIRRLKSLCHS
ncbi:MAG: DUF5659 domain-containing protein [Paludibacteraceae bacterium]|nr:DUF5659 domain-containing protein [Paludibacteraceae bacterium]MCK9615927.1 DUF5659 domain-containing protein [Candidatus Omnitrophota bacterium]